MSDFVGKNEKTKITAKLQRKGVGPPSREQIFNEEEKKKLMANAYKSVEGETDKDRQADTNIRTRTRPLTTTFCLQATRRD